MQSHFSINSSRVGHRKLGRKFFLETAELLELNSSWTRHSPFPAQRVNCAIHESDTCMIFWLLCSNKWRCVRSSRIECRNGA